jgi:hypothetical protein
VEHSAPRPSHAERKAAKEAARRRAQFVATARGLNRARLVIGAVLLATLALGTACGATGLPLFCAVDTQWYAFISAGLLGAFLGLTIRIFREQRRLERSLEAPR